ncbi:MAG: DUF2793 domain-containing protein [Rhizobiales bacterium]|nr:DUF2793 domain-containing protein [Hyphomicrobiales bacterium]
MESTTNLDLPYIMPSQAQKHVTHNEALELLDALVQCRVVDRDLTAPPASPGEGACYIVASGAGGVWDGQDGRIALRRDGDWRFLPPRQGWLAWVLDENLLVHWTGTVWQPVADLLAAPQNLALLGVGTTADTTNPFAAKLNKALWTARASGEGGDGSLRYTLNKEGAANVLSLLMQSNWSGRAEIGLVGSDDLAIRVSADGSAWKEALRIDRSSGRVALPNTNMLRDAVFNLLPDSGRFAGNSTKSGPAGAFAKPAYLTLHNGTTADDSCKFITDNTDYGGAAGALPAAVKDLVDMIRAPSYRRLGAEFRVAEMTMGAGTAAAQSFGGNTYYLSNYIAATPRLPAQTFHAYIRALDGPVLWRLDGGQVLIRNGVRSTVPEIIAPADGWVSITMQDAVSPYNSYNHYPYMMNIYARASGHRYLLACLTLTPGIIEMDDNVGIVNGINGWLP